MAAWCASCPTHQPWSWLVPLALERIGIGNTLLVAAGITFVGLLASLWLAPETRSLSLQEAAALR